MSRHHSAIAHQSNAIVANLHDMDYDQIHDYYGIDIDPSGVVIDNTYNMEFANLSEWADWCVANDEFEERELIKHRHYDILT